MSELITIKLGGHNKITDVHTFLNKYEKLGYVRQGEPKKKRVRRAPQAESLEATE